MYITSNTAGTKADVCLATDPDARDLCVVAIKGTFYTDGDGVMTLAAEQQELTYTDQYYGAPQSTSIRYESDFASEKARTDVIVVGKAIAPKAHPVEELIVRLEVQRVVKELLVVGDRRWRHGLVGVTPSRPQPFSEMPLIFERAFGGEDNFKGENHVAVERRNPVGVGFHHHRPAERIVGLPLPNIEHPRQRLRGPHDRPDPVGMGCIGRAWKPRIDHAGTYDQRWLDEVCPFLPRDFNSRYLQCAPEDQQFPLFEGGELIRCVNMSESGGVDYRLPTGRIPVRFRFSDRVVERDARLDTVIVLPHEKRAMLTWRTQAPLGKKWNQLREVMVGRQPEPIEVGLAGFVHGKPKFRGLAAAIHWLNRRPQRRA